MRSRRRVALKKIRKRELLWGGRDGDGFPSQQLKLGEPLGFRRATKGFIKPDVSLQNNQNRNMNVIQSSVVKLSIPC